MSCNDLAKNVDEKSKSDIDEDNIAHVDQDMDDDQTSQTSVNGLESCKNGDIKETKQKEPEIEPETGKTKKIQIMILVLFLARCETRALRIQITLGGRWLQKKEIQDLRDQAISDRRLVICD